MPLKNRNIAILVGCVALFLAIIYGYVNFLYKPVHNAIVTETKNLADLTTKVEMAKARASQLNRIQAEMQSLQVEVVQLERQLPKGKELPALIRVFTHRAESFGLAMSSFAPQKAIAKGLYDEVPYQISLTTSYHNLGHFLTAMGKGERLFAARNLALQGSSNKADTSKTVTATFTLIAFKYHE